MSPPVTDTGVELNLGVQTIRKTETHFPGSMDSEEERANNAMRMLESLPANIVRDFIYPFAIRIFQNKQQLRAAVIEYMQIQSSGRPFPEGYCPIQHWDVSKVTDFSWLFANQTSFRGDLSDLSTWDVSNGTNFRAMFSGCHSFNSDLSRWDVSAATDLSDMFSGCESFDSNLSRWNVSGATDLSFMFHGCESFNSDLSGWDVSGATSLSNMFYDCRSFNSDLSGWDVSNVIFFRGMFFNCPPLSFDPLQWELTEEQLDQFHLNGYAGSDESDDFESDHDGSDDET